MTRKDYKVIAESLKETKPPRYSDEYETWRAIVINMANSLFIAYSNFDVRKFYTHIEFDGFES